MLTGEYRWPKAPITALAYDSALYRSRPDEPLVFGIDETVERRWGRKIAAKGRYRDAVRSTDDQVVMTPGLQWVSLMLLTRIGWAGRGRYRF